MSLELERSIRRHPAGKHRPRPAPRPARDLAPLTLGEGVVIVLAGLATAATVVLVARVIWSVIA